jgi:hypothetical protein
MGAYKSVAQRSISLRHQDEMRTVGEGMNYCRIRSSTSPTIR